jgi:hypothetical protein
VLGSLQALLTTGDIRLIHSESLRSAITKYYDQATSTIASSEDAIRVSSDAYAALNELVDYSDLSAEYSRITGKDELDVRSPAAVPLGDEFHFVAPGDRQSRFHRSPADLLSDRRLAGLLVTIQIAKRNNANQRRFHMTRAISLRKQIERELGRDTLVVLRDSVRR